MLIETGVKARFQVRLSDERMRKKAGNPYRKTAIQ
jgi:hypothetical protein